MQDFEDKVAVVTGGASGIGRGMAQRFVDAGMRIVLADVDEDALAQTASEFAEHGATVLAVPTDVTRPDDVAALARRVFDELGGAHVICNNAGVNAPNVPIWEVGLEDWDFVVGVNMLGVIHGIHAFVPLMLEQGEEGHIVNTASAAGLGSRPGISPYVATKHAVVALSESLHHDLREAGSKLHVSVLCPGRIRTRMIERHLAEEGVDIDADAELRASYMLPAEVGDLVIEAIRDERFYILTHPDSIKERVRDAADDILLGRDPTHSLPISS